MNEVLPDSFKRPYLIKITSEWCFTCIHIEPIWKDTVQDLEPLGGGISYTVSVCPCMHFVSLAMDFFENEIYLLLLLFGVGVGIGVVDIGFERQLANHLGAHRTPSILGVINGKVSFFQYAVAREYLKQFVESLLPTKLVEKVRL